VRRTPHLPRRTQHSGDHGVLFLECVSAWRSLPTPIALRLSPGHVWRWLPTRFQGLACVLSQSSYLLTRQPISILLFCRFPHTKVDIACIAVF
jgi:hypothetical protein